MRSLPGNLGCRFFSFSTLNISCHSLLACRVSAETSAVKCMEFPCMLLVAFPLLLFFFFGNLFFYFGNIWQFINQWNILNNKLLHISGRRNTRFENTLPTEFGHNTSTQLREAFVQSRSLLLHPTGHKFIGNWLQQFRFLSIGPHEVCFSGWSSWVQLNPNPFLFGFLLFLIIFLHMFQEPI